MQQLRLSSTPNESDLKRKIKSLHKFQHITKCTPSCYTKNDGRKGGKGDSEYWIIGKECRSAERETRRVVWERESKELGGEWREKNRGMWIEECVYQVSRRTCHGTFSGRAAQIKLEDGQVRKKGERDQQRGSPTYSPSQGTPGRG